MSVKIRIICAVAVALAMAPFGAASAGDLPSGEEVIAKYVKAVGGDALKKIKNRVTKGIFSLPDMGMVADMESYIEPPNSYTLIKLEAFGDVMRGSKDGVAWEVNPMQGARVLEGAEKDEFARQGELNEFVNWKKYYSNAECTGEETVGETVAYKVVMTPNNGDESTVYFAKDSGLMIQRESMQQGMLNVTTIGDYKEVDGVQIPHSITTSGGMMAIEITLESVEHNVDIAADRFEYPTEIDQILNPPPPAPEVTESTEGSDSKEEAKEEGSDSKEDT